MRLSDPEGTGLLADANLTQVLPDGTVTWLIARSTGSKGQGTHDEAAHEATASPLQRNLLGQLRAGVQRWSVFLGVGTVVVILLAGAWLQLRHRSG